MPTIPQAAALPVRDGKICLVTSRTRRRWVIPKGWIDPGHTPAQAALIEAWEEAGLVGVLRPEPLGDYRYAKGGRDHHVTVFVLRVTDEKPVWPERASRTRVWLPPAEAAARVDDAGLAALIRTFSPDEDPLAPAGTGSAAD